MDEIYPPQTGTGFTAAENGKIIPEYECWEDGEKTYLLPQDGAELYEVSADGEEKLIGIYDKDEKKFIEAIAKREEK